MNEPVAATVLEVPAVFWGLVVGFEVAREPVAHVEVLYLPALPKVIVRILERVLHISVRSLARPQNEDLSALCARVSSSQVLACMVFGP